MSYNHCIITTKTVYVLQKFSVSIANQLTKVMRFDFPPLFFLHSQINKHKTRNVELSIHNSQSNDSIFRFWHRITVPNLFFGSSFLERFEHFYDLLFSTLANEKFSTKTCKQKTEINKIYPIGILKSTSFERMRIIVTCEFFKA